eukprot:gene8848-10485_t
MELMSRLQLGLLRVATRKLDGLLKSLRARKSLALPAWSAAVPKEEYDEESGLTRKRCLCGYVLEVEEI